MLAPMLSTTPGIPRPAPWHWLLLLALLLSSPLPADAQRLRVYTWADIMDFAVIDAFEAETGLRVDYDTYRSREALEARLAAGLDDLDLVMLPDDLLAELASAGRLRVLEPQHLDNWQHLDPTLLVASHALDPPPRHGVPYFWGVSGLAMEPATVRQRLPDAPLDTLGLLLDPARVAKLADCGVWLPDSAGEVIPAVLDYLGEPRSSAESAALTRVEAHLQALWPYLAGVDSRAYLDRLAEGEACLALGWSDGVLRAQEVAANLGKGPLAFRVPREGARLWLDVLVIPADAPQPGAALRLLDYLLRPAVAARVANHAYLAPTNRASWPLLLAEIRDNPLVLPPVPAGGFYTVAPDPRVRARWADLWQRLKSGEPPPLTQATPPEPAPDPGRLDPR